MPTDMTRYPDNWKDIRNDILDRENHCCKFCGVPNYSVGMRDRAGKFYTFEEIERRSNRGSYWAFWEFGDPDITTSRPSKMIKIVLTIAHLGVPMYPGHAGDKTDKMDVRYINLAALCQKCHLNWDHDEHAENRRKTLAKKRYDEIEETGQLPLFDLL